MTRMQPYVFISYSRTENTHVSQISEVLTRCKVEHFLDSKDIDQGSDIEEDVATGIIRSLHLLIIVSPSSLESLCVGYEIGRAKALGKTVIPFLTYPNLEVPTLLSRLNSYADLERVERYFSRLTALDQMAA